MGYWSETDLPFYYGLARTFPVADHWFSSCLGPTFPNRRFLIAGTAHGLIDDSPYDLLDYPPTGTIFDMLTRHRISWANYHPVTADQSQVAALCPARQEDGQAPRSCPCAGRCPPCPRTSRRTSSSPPTSSRSGSAGTCSTSAASRCSSSRTPRTARCRPSASWTPTSTTYSEENPQDIRKGESFAAEVINAVLHGPRVAGHPADLAL